MRKTRLLVIVSAALALSGCVASTIISAPFKAAGTIVETAVDSATQTENEREEDVGRKVLAEEKKQKEREKYCRKNPDACDD